MRQPAARVLRCVPATGPVESEVAAGTDSLQPLGWRQATSTEAYVIGPTTIIDHNGDATTQLFTERQQEKEAWCLWFPTSVGAKTGRKRSSAAESDFTLPPSPAHSGSSTLKPTRHLGARLLGRTKGRCRFPGSEYEPPAPVPAFGPGTHGTGASLSSSQPPTHRFRWHMLPYLMLVPTAGLIRVPALEQCCWLAFLASLPLAGRFSRCN